MELLYRFQSFCVICFAFMCLLEGNPISHFEPTTPAEQQVLITILKGDALSEVGLYSQAMEHYNEALTDASRLLRSYGLYQLAHAALKSEQTGPAISALISLTAQRPLNVEEQQIYYDGLYLLGIAHKQAHDYSAAKKAFAHYLEETPQAQRTQGEEATFQWGLLHFLEGDMAAATLIWKPLHSQTKNPRLQSLLDLYQVRMALHNGHHEVALAKLQALAKKQHAGFIQDEIDFLLGETYFQLRHYRKALEIFQKLLASPLAKEQPWYAQAIDYVGQASLKMGVSTSPSLHHQKEHLLNAKETLGQLYARQPNEKNALALSEALILLAEKLSDASYYREAQHLLALLESNKEKKQHADALAYLQGVVASRHAKDDDLAMQAFLRAAESSQSRYADQALHQLGALYYRTGNLEQAEAAYLRLAQEHPESDLCAEGWFWSAICAEKLQKEPKLVKERKQRVWERFPESAYAPEAYFSLYTTAEYIQGDRSTIKHLQHFITQFPTSPLTIEAHYLLGMDLKRDRKTAEGKWIRKKSLTEAIDAFQMAETTFTRFNQSGEIPKEQRDHLINVRYQASLEKALANLAIANEAIGAKKKIYLEYAEESFLKLNKELENLPDSPLYEEAMFGLAQTYIKQENDGEAEALLTSLQQKYKKAQIAQNYYLSRVWYELGMIAFKKNQMRSALDAFKSSEAAGKGGVLSTDQRLDLWIQKSFCYRALGDYDQALLLLSKTVNDDAISSLRLKAMYLRAETYEMMGKTELARKQLESLAKKGGYWGNESKHKLETSYGY